MKIGVLTLSLHTNYGGILQAYALQTVLKRMGHDVILFGQDHIDQGHKRYCSSSLIFYPSYYYWWLKYRVKKVCSIGKEVRIDRFLMKSRKTNRFIKKYIDYQIIDRWDEIQKSHFDAIVAGSDQIWRPLYFEEIENAYLAFAEHWNIKRVAYAASFGTNRWEYTDKQTLRCVDLIQKFDAVSVREASAVGLCRQYFNLQSVQHLLDPTMLLAMSDYLRFISPTYSNKQMKQLTTYILDMDQDKQLILNDLVHLESFECRNVGEETVTSKEKKICPSLESWIQGLYEADLVFTDSFHGCVFSILFHKAFIVFPNERRGIDRFDSLLQLFGLELRSVTSFKEYKERRFLPIDWDRIDKLLNEKREQSFSFFKKALS